MRATRAHDQDAVRVVRGADGLFRVEGTDRLFTGEILHAESREAFIGRELTYCPECGAEKGS
jgi:hypothetical protein